MKSLELWTYVEDGEHCVVDEQTAGEYPPSFVHKWEFAYTPLTGQHLLQVALALHSQPGLFLPDGLEGDRTDYSVERCAQVLHQTLNGWNRKTDTGEDLPISLDNIRGLPVGIILAAGDIVEFHRRRTPEEAWAQEEALAKKKET
jgi:hypothetical protein